jgi:hypothetical protein
MLGLGLLIVPSSSSDIPSNAAAKGSIRVTSAGVPYHNVDGSTTWHESVLASLKGTFVWDPPYNPAMNGASTDVNVTGAAMGDFVIVSAPYDLDNYLVGAYVKSADVIHVIMLNLNGVAKDLASGTWKYKVIKY